jgi:PPP family 3-phenylpropionic acid transporter
MVTYGGYFYVGTLLTALFVPRPLRSSGQAVYAFALSGLATIIAAFLGGWIFENLGGVLLYKFGGFSSLLGSLGLAAMWYRIYKNGYKPIIKHEIL